MLRYASIFLSAASSILLLFCIDTRYWHLLILGFEGTLVYGALAFWLGSILAAFAVILSALAAARKPAGRPLSLALCAWNIALLLGFLLLYRAA